MKRIALLFGLVVVAAGCAPGGVYRDEYLGFTFRYPRGWECQYDEVMFGAVVCWQKWQLETEGETCSPWIEIAIDPWGVGEHTEPTTAAEMLADGLEEMSGRYGGIASTGEIQVRRVAGLDAAVVDVRWEDSAEDCQVSRYALVNYGGTEVWLSGFSPAEQGESMVQAFDTMLDSMAFPPPPTAVVAAPGPWQRTVDEVSSLLPGQIPDHLLAYDAVKTGEEFDVNRFFSVLDHLSVKPGYTLDWVYFYEGIGGEPLLYARPVDQPPYRTAAEYGEAEGHWSLPETRYLDHVQVDGTAGGFFQFVVLHAMGSQFYQYWHAAYNDTIIVCDRAGLEALLSPSGPSGRLPLDLREKALTLDLKPVVELEEDLVLVRVLTFTKWGGFKEKRFTIRREFPHEILQIEEQTLIEYDCGFTF